MDTNKRDYLLVNLVVDLFSIDSIRPAGGGFQGDVNH
jgi:hypothetical protein